MSPDQTTPEPAPGPVFDSPPSEAGPEQRPRHLGIRGTAVRLGDDREWLLADFVPAHSPAWDRLYDANVMDGQYTLPDVRAAAWALLLANYTVSGDEAARLIVGARPKDLVKAVDSALFGPEVIHRTYGDWVNASLYGNGLDPAKIPASQHRIVLEMLVKTGRAVPESEFVSSHEGAAMRRKIMAMIAGQAGMGNG
jgi:hypothetical protein